MTWMARSPNLNITLSAESKERLRRLAQAEKRTMSQLAALLIDEGIDRLEGKVANGEENQG